MFCSAAEQLFVTPSQSFSRRRHQGWTRRRVATCGNMNKCVTDDSYDSELSRTVLRLTDNGCKRSWTRTILPYHAAIMDVQAGRLTRMPIKLLSVPPDDIIVSPRGFNETVTRLGRGVYMYASCFGDLLPRRRPVRSRKACITSTHK